jgi:CobQ-like glutamine amidotransferase family enzyme
MVGDSARGGDGMSARKLRLVQLYPAQMNIYGDHGNQQVLAKRAELYGFEVTTSAFSIGDDTTALEEADLILGGGGQDSGQLQVADDLRRVGTCLCERTASKVPMLMVCGLYQLFGRSFVTSDGTRLEGIGVFDIRTVGGRTRLIGNAVITTAWGRMTGYENHSGRTTLAASQTPLGRVVSGAGNNGQDGLEGARTLNVIGTYLHGPILPKNPALADDLLRLAVTNRYGDEALTPADAAAATTLTLLDALAAQASAVAASRPR